MCQALFLLVISLVRKRAFRSNTNEKLNKCHASEAGRMGLAGRNGFVEKKASTTQNR